MIPGPEKKFWATVWSDLLLLVNHNKALILFALAAVFWVSPLSRAWNERLLKSDFGLFYGSPQLLIVEGEKPAGMNTVEFWIQTHKDVFGKRSLAINTDRLPSEGFISLKYHLPVERAGRYKLFVAGRAPGGSSQKGRFDYSPYKVVLDGAREVPIDEEGKTELLMRIFKSRFFLWYSYADAMVFTKVGDFVLEPGEHEIEFRIAQPAPHSRRYIFVIDAVFLVPEGWTPSKPFSTFPDDVFSY